MAEWCELPKELLHLISQRLDSTLYRLCFRSVCSSWRSSSPLSPFSIPLSLTTAFSLSHRSLILFTPPNNINNNTQRPWLVKIDLDPRASTPRLFHPLSRFPLKLTRFALDLLRLPFLDLGREFLLTPDPTSLYMEKLVFLSAAERKDSFALLTIHVSGRLALFRSGDQSWTVLRDMPTPYDDVCVFERTLYGVDGNGRAVTVGLDARLGLAAEPVFGGDRKFLVESQGKLLLVDMHLSNYYFCNQGSHDENDVAEIGWERTVKFDVFWLDREGKRWVELHSLGERVLFLGDHCAFSASASDLGLPRGNCIVFRDDGLGPNRVANGIGVFSLDDGTISPLADSPGFSQLFWPPPDWIRLHH